MKVLVTGSAGFIAGYLVDELLRCGHQVVGIDNGSSYGRVARSYDKHPAYQFVVGDAKDIDQMCELAEECDQIVALASRGGDASYARQHAYDVLAENERIAASTFDAAIHAFQAGHLKKINVLSAASVFESTHTCPTPEGAQLVSPPPQSTWGFQRLACEYFARGAWEQYRLPYTIIRPFSCVGVGERTSVPWEELTDGNVQLSTSHLVADLLRRVLQGQSPLRIAGSGEQAHYLTYGGDLARGIVTCMEHPAALNNELNLSTDLSTTDLELARLSWEKIHPGKPFRYVSDPPPVDGAQHRIPETSKARLLLGFEARTSITQVLDELIPWMQAAIATGRI